MENTSVQSSQPSHRVWRVLQAHLQLSPDRDRLLQSRFRVQLRCDCCMNKIVVASRQELTTTYGLSEMKVRQIEAITLRHLKSREFKQNSDELFGFLSFSDVEDFSAVPKDAFVEFKLPLRRSLRSKKRC